MAIVPVILALADDYVAKFAEVVQQCEAVGLKVDNGLAETGIVTGSIDEAMLADLEHVEGVAAVETQRAFLLPPPDDDVQ